jgi:hypothetical protein
VVGRDRFVAADAPITSREKEDEGKGRRKCLKLCSCVYVCVIMCYTVPLFCSEFVFCCPGAERSCEDVRWKDN